jgi:putative DNA primase/helicase
VLTPKEIKFNLKAATARAKLKTRVQNGPLIYINASQVRTKKITWIWAGHLAAGQQTCIAGVQGDGKSQLVYAIAAAVTTGGKWPGSDEKAPLGNVIVLNAEDTLTDVLVPRLVAAGCDLKRITIIQAVRGKDGDRKFNLQADLAHIKTLAKKIGDVKLITFDPVSSYFGGELDSHENTHLRNALDPITATAEETGAANISVTHFNKAAKGVSALNRVMGGAGFTAAPRAAFAVIRDAVDKSKRMFLPLKCNLMAEGKAYGMIFHIEEVDAGEDTDTHELIRAPRIVWDGETKMTADEALLATLTTAKVDKGLSPSLVQAMEFLVGILADGPVLCSDVEHEAKEARITGHSLRKARETLGIVSTKLADEHGQGPWQWSLAPEVAGVCDFDETKPEPEQDSFANPHQPAKPIDKNAWCNEADPCA